MGDENLNMSIDEFGNYKGGYIYTSVRLTTHLFQLCKKHNLKFTEAMRVGVSVMLAERGLVDYDNNLNLYRKMIIYQEKAEQYLQEAETLRTTLELLKKQQSYNNDSA